jgi:peptidoglycan/LPS O-acetylase OafA/YrhL
MGGQQRIAVLDGFRAIAILMVVFFHYFSQWTPPRSPENFYPYASAYAALFDFGYLGVDFFFMISGFVIAMTLGTCSTWFEFAVRRFSRLWPAMVICAAITYLALRLLPATYFPTAALNFLPSLTFTDPILISKLLGMKVDWMSGVYWSLFTEVRFYVWAAVLYFSFRKRLQLSYLLFMNAAAMFDLMMHGATVNILLLPMHLPLFGMGLGLYYLHKNRADRTAAVLVANSFGLACAYAAPGELPFYALFLAMFCMFIYYPAFLAPLGSGWFAAVGAGSYSLYLLHQDIGVTVIALTSEYFDLRGAAAIPVTVGVILAMVLLSSLIYRLWEQPSKNLILRALQKPSGVVSAQLT